MREGWSQPWPLTPACVWPLAGDAANSDENLYDGCFPAFHSVDDFATYVQGRWWEAHGTPTNTVGIILSVFFWLGLAGVGYLL